MALNASGPISLGGSTSGQSINLELGLSATAVISLNDAAVRTLLGVASGAITLNNAYGKSNVTQGQQAYTTAGTYTFVVPAGVTSISGVCVGAGASGSDARGGLLSYSNNIATTPGESLTVVVPADTSYASLSRGATALIRARGGGSGGTDVGDFTGVGGSPRDTNGSFVTSGGGGASGYTNADGYQVGQNALGGWGGGGAGAVTAGIGGAGGGGGRGGENSVTNQYVDIVDIFSASGGGGGVGLLGLGSNGAAGTSRSSPSTLGGGGGGGGSGGDSGTSGGNGNSGNGGVGGAFGGAGGRGVFTQTYVWDENLQEYVGDSSYEGTHGSGGVGGVRIMWGTGRSYPSNAANV